MKHLIILFALLISMGCAALSIKCPVNSLPPSPTHEELIKQEIHKDLLAKLEKSAWKQFESTIALLQLQGLTNVSLTAISFDVIDGMYKPLGIVEASLHSGTQKAGNLYFLFIYTANDWEMNYAIPIGLGEQEGE